mmetsp:Transcript_1902/g.2380  ORF Transcript_1902/g.2380 Transcript_1902/m.2380 type:complete len:113 (-) Transcript_1902:2-340(-)
MNGSGQCILTVQRNDCLIQPVNAGIKEKMKSLVKEMLPYNYLFLVALYEYSLKFDEKEEKEKFYKIYNKFVYSESELLIENPGIKEHFRKKLSEEFKKQITEASKKLEELRK